MKGICECDIFPEFIHSFFLNFFSSSLVFRGRMMKKWRWVLRGLLLALAWVKFWSEKELGVLSPFCGVIMFWDEEESSGAERKYKWGLWLLCLSNTVLIP